MAEALVTKSMRARMIGLALLASTSLVPCASAHRLDEYLQATLVTIEPTCIRLQINCTPGVQVAEPMLGTIDRDQDGEISEKEAVAYAALFREALHVRLDKRDLPLTLAASSFPPIPDLRTGTGIIQLEFTVSIDPLKPGVHTLSIENRNLPALSVYLLNASKPSSKEIEITAQRRNDDQSTGQIEFTWSGDPKR